MQMLVNFITGVGVGGLMLAMALEGASVPIPGIIVVLTLGYLLDFTTLQLVFIAALMSLIYSAASCIPYAIGYKLEKAIKIKYEKQLGVVQKYFQKYGEYSVAILRPFALGNYISYFAGMSKVKPWKYLMLTFIGIYPWAFIMLFISKFTKGNIKAALLLIQSNMGYVYVTISFVVLALVGFSIYRRSVVIQNKVK